MNKLILLSVFLAIFVLFLIPPTDPDLFWHLRYGEEILKKGFPYTDQFSFTFPGYLWADSYWLSEVLIYYLIAKTGFLLPVLFFAFLGAGTFLAVGLGSSIEKTDVRAVSLAAFLGAIVAWPIIGVRVQTISLVLLGLTFIFLHQFWLKKRPKLILFLPLIFIFWANLHAGFMLGLILIWLFWLTELIRFIISHQLYKPIRRSILSFNLKITSVITPQLDYHQLKRLLGINILASVVTLINPYGFFLWQTIFNDAGSVKIKNLISEWLAPNPHSEFGLIFFLFIFGLVILSFLAGKKIHPTRFVILLAFSLLALSAVRHISVFALTAVPLLAEYISDLFRERLKAKYSGLVLISFFILFAAATVYQIFPKTYKATRSVKDLAEAGNYPYEAVEYLKNHPPKRMFNEYGWGGYLIWQLPSNRTFIDGRMPGWKQDGREILDDYQKIADLKKDFVKILEFWQIKTVLISTDYPLAEYLKASSGWEKKFEDKQAVIFTKK